MKASEKKALAAEAIADLSRMLSPGMTVYVMCDHVARSGMSRRLHCYIVEDGAIRNISGYVAHALGYPRHHQTGGFTVGGCGMDMGFAVVYNLASTLFRDVPYVSERRSGSHNPGYMLKHEWL